MAFAEILSVQRHKLGPNTTPVTAESFAKWKADRKAREKAEAEADMKQKKEAYDKYKAGMKSGITFSGKELFEFNPDWAKGEDEDEGAMEEYARADSDTEEARQDRQDYENTAMRDARGASPDIAEDLFQGEDLEGILDDDEEDDD